MADKNLPIKFFEKRQKDEQATEGSGGGKLPEWVIQDRVVIRERSTYYRSVLASVSASLIKKVEEDNFLPSVIRLKLNDDAIAKSYRKDIAKLFNVDGKLNLIGFSSKDELLVKVDNADDLRYMSENFNAVEKEYYSPSVAIGISAIEDLTPYAPDVDVDLNQAEVLKVKLFNYHDHDLNSVLTRAFENYCKENSIDFQQTVYSADLNIYSVTNSTKDNLEELIEFDGVQSISEMPTFSLSLDELQEDNNLPVKKPEADKEYPIVGVLDTGIAKIPHLAPWIVKESHTNYVEDDINRSHGTFVAGVLVYGDELEGKNYTGFGECKLFEAIIYPDETKQKIYEHELIQQIREAISTYDHIKIWNLSLGTKTEADMHKFSDFAQTLDEIQEQHNVLVCKSAGNCGNFLRNAPRGRITCSADSVRSIVVGSIAHEKIDTDLAEKHYPSPFTRVGPGPSHLIKPDVVHFGGNAGMNARNELVKNCIKSFSTDGSIAHNVGTSFSTPRVSAIAAGLNHMISEAFNPLLLKALVIHSSKYPSEMALDISEKIRMAGFGLPANVKDILFNDPNEITLILQDTLEKGSFVNIMDFPYPQSMVDEEGYFYGEVTITLATSPILDASQGAEYCQSNMDVYFGSYDEKVDRDITLPHIKNPIKPEGNKNLLDEGIYSKRAVKNIDNKFTKERVLLAYGRKYQPVKKWVVSFDELTDTNRENFLKAPKQWYLKLQGVYRDFTEAMCEKQNITPKQEFCLIVTIRDTKKKGNIYNEVTQLLDTYSFIHKNIKIKEQVKIKLGN
ncbi:S8 family peptidase [Lacibacter sediminis]|uniref:S8 family peptidase n=1 Tax=Lacibacter sediminis TaxID=2760713 RepID=A0A7G5XK50_9BACT|nr:S8 family peptidase [Lacibacter sediminis]QNA45853.1 S8 family peptidase [Lacibacter sediminis]